MDAGEAVVLFGVVMAALVCIAGIMVRNPLAPRAGLN